MHAHVDLYLLANSDIIIIIIQMCLKEILSQTNKHEHGQSVLFSKTIRRIPPPYTHTYKMWLNLRKKSQPL